MASDATDPRSQTRQLSRDFDSTSATRRLAALTEQIREVESILDEPPPVAVTTRPPVASATIPPAPSEPAPARKAIELDATQGVSSFARPFPVGAAALLGGLLVLNVLLVVLWLA